MEEAYEEKSGFMGGVAKVLNVGGGAVVFMYDMTSDGLGQAWSLAKKTPVLPDKIVDVFASAFGVVKHSKTKHVEEKIQDYERKIQALYFEIGKEGANYGGDESALETEPIKQLIADVREYEKEIERLKIRIVEIKEQKRADALKRKEVRKSAQLAKRRVRVADEKVQKRVQSAIAKAVRHAEFETRSEREIFDKVANDLLDTEIEIKVLAAAELGKIGNEAAVPILVEAVKFGDPDLTSETTNSLIMIGDVRAIPVFKENANDAKYRVRIGCLRGLYKLAEDQEAIPVLIAALRDEHPEVRRTAATFIGWKDYQDAVPSLVQCLRDEDVRVRKAAVSSLANIKDSTAVSSLIRVLGDKDIEIREKALEAIRVISGEEITFDVNASGKALTEAINNLRDQWQQERIGEGDMAEAAVEEEAAEEVAEVAEAEEAPEAEEPEAETPEESEESKFTEEKLMRMIKSELLDLCAELDIEYDEKQTKAELTQLILKEKE